MELQIAPVNCIHATPTQRLTMVHCKLGLFAGRPHVVMCRGCRQRVAARPEPPPIPRELLNRSQSNGRIPAGRMMRGKAVNGEQHSNGRVDHTRSGVAVQQKLLLRSHLSPGDIVMLTATIRDLHLAYPGRFRTDVETSAVELWEHNPHITKLNRGDRSLRAITMHYPLVNQSNQRPVHFLQGYTEYLESQLNLKIPVTQFKGDIHLSAEEKGWTSQIEQDFGYKDPFWIMIAGGKYDFTAKWWPPDYYQRVVDHLQGRVQFVQCGEKGHWHPELKGVLNLIGKTSLRQFIRLIYHAAGVICPVTLAMHLAAAIPAKTNRLRPCVVIAGGREPPHWEAYPGHQFLHTIGMLPCCATGGCWKSRCQKVGDHDVKDRDNLCERPIQVTPEIRVPQCMTMIRPEQVIEAVEGFISFTS
jgi:ADP-heptose:LPS heptosyltransferase